LLNGLSVFPETGKKEGEGPKRGWPPEKKPPFRLLLPGSGNVEPDVFYINVLIKK
jgi:hypothetical protein